MIGRLLGLLGNIPHALFIKAAVYALVFTIGLAVGNNHATERALQRELQASADRQRENNAQLLEWAKKKAEEIKVAAEQQREADEEAFRVYQAGIVSASKAKALAERRLAAASADTLKLKDTADGLRKVNELLAMEIRIDDPGCVLSPGVRRALDTATNLEPDSDPRTSESTTPGLPDGPYSGTTPLTCQQLAAGYVNLAEHDRMMIAWVLAFQRWSFEVSQ